MTGLERNDGLGADWRDWSGMTKPNRHTGLRAGIHAMFDLGGAVREIPYQVRNDGLGTEWRAWSGMAGLERNDGLGTE